MKNRSPLRISLLVQSICLAFYSFGTFGENFNSSLLVGNSAEMDWNNDKLVMTPGQYDLDVYVNDLWQGKFDFIFNSDRVGALKIKREDIALLNIEELDPILKNNSSEFINVDVLLHGGKSQLLPGEMRLNLTVPQAFIATKSRNWVSPQKWDQGINGFYTNYNFNYYNFHGLTSDYANTDNFFLSLNSGLNLAGWHLIDNSSWMHSSTTKKSTWSNTTRYVERPVAALGSIFRIGRSYTSSDYFDTFRFRGITLNKNRQMLPDSERVYMPVISGIANGSAVVSIYQDDHIIHQINVPPGPFSIRDLMPTGSRSDLSVEVKNTGGDTEHFVVPFSSIPDMLRPGTTDYQFNLGEIDIRNVDDSEKFAQLNFSSGINNYLTTSTGAILSENYQSLLLGSAVSIPYLGSLSGSVEEAFYRLPEDKQSRGEKYSLSWSKYFPSKTNISLASYYYRTQDYASLGDYVQMKSNAQTYGSSTSTINSKQAFSANINQVLPYDLGRLSLSGYWRDYWKDRNSSRQYNLTWSSIYNSMNYSLSLRRSEMTQSYYNSETDFDGDVVSELRSRPITENSIYFSLTIPMTIFGSGGSVSTHASVQNNKYSSSDVSLNGSTSDIDYSLMLSHDNEGDSRSADLYASWKNEHSSLNSGLTLSREYRQASLGASGNALLWRGGLLTSANMGRNFVILDAPGVKAAAVNGDETTKTNSRGIALVTSATPYRQNNFHLVEDGMQSSNVELIGNMLNIAPYEGSITYLKYKTDTRKLFTLEVLKADSEKLPFGAFVYDLSNNELGYVSQGSQIFIKEDALPHKIKVILRNGKNKKECIITEPSESVVNICQ